MLDFMGVTFNDTVDNVAGAFLDFICDAMEEDVYGTPAPEDEVLMAA